MSIFGAGAGIKPASVAAIGPYCTQISGKLGIITPAVFDFGNNSSYFPMLFCSGMCALYENASQ